MAGNNLLQILRGSNPSANHILNPGQLFYNKDKKYLHIGYKNGGTATQDAGSLIKVRELIGYTADSTKIGTSKSGEYYLKHINNALELKSSGTTPIKILNDSTINIKAANNLELEQGDQFLKLTSGGLTGEASNIELVSSSNIKLDATDNIELDATSLIVKSTTSLMDNLTVSKNTVLQGALDVAGDVQLTSDLDVEGAVNLNSTLSVDGITRLYHQLYVGTQSKHADINFFGQLAVSDATTLKDTLRVSKSTVLMNTLNVGDATTLDKTLNVAGATTLSNTLDVSKDIYLRDNVHVYEKLLKGGAENYLGVADVSSISFPYIGTVRVKNISANDSPYNSYGLEISAYSNYTGAIKLGLDYKDNDKVYFSGLRLDINGTDENVTLNTYNMKTILQDDVTFTTGSLTLSPGQVSETSDSISYALNCNNSNIIGINGLYIGNSTAADPSNQYIEGLHFQNNDGTKLHTLLVDGSGLLLYYPNRPKGGSVTRVFSVDASGVVTANKFKGITIPTSISVGNYGLCLYNNNDGIIPANNYISFNITAANKSILAGNNTTDIGDNNNYFKDLYINTINLGYVPLKNVNDQSVNYLELANNGAEYETALTQTYAETYLDSNRTYLCTLKCYYRADTTDYFTVSTVLTACDINKYAYSGCIYLGTYALPLRLRYIYFREGSLRSSHFSIVKVGQGSTAQLSALFSSIRLTIKEIA